MSQFSPTHHERHRNFDEILGRQNPKRAAKDDTSTITTTTTT
jgi:hypothetical protein